MDPLNISAKFEVRSFTHSWHNRGYSKNLGSPCIRPRSLFSKIFHGLVFGWTLWMYRPNLQSVALAISEISVREYVFFVFFQISKKRDFYVFLKWLWKKRKKSVAKILSSMMLTSLQKRETVCWMSIEILAPMLWVLIGIYHTQFSVAYFLVSTLLSKMFDVGDRDLPVLTSGNWVIKGWVIKWPVKLRTFFTTRC